MPQLSLGEFVQRPATQIVSLGAWCAVTYNIHRHYNFSSAFPFDWWMTPEPGLIAVLRRLDVTYIYDPAQLTLSEGAGTVIHRETGIWLHHEFPRHWNEPSQPVRADFIEHLAEPRRRSAYLINKFLGLDRDAERILFIRDQPIGSALPPAFAEIFHRAEWAIASIAHTPQDTGFDWRGDPLWWDAQLGALGASLEPGRHKPFSEATVGHVDEPIPEPLPANLPQPG